VLRLWFRKLKHFYGPTLVPILFWLVALLLFSVVCLFNSCVGEYFGGEDEVEQISIGGTLIVAEKRK
jgi:hypothetical protein